MTLFGFYLVLDIVFFLPPGILSYIRAAVQGVDETGETLPGDWRLVYQVLCPPMLVESALLIVRAWFFFNRRSAARPLVIVAIVVGLAINTAAAARRAAQL